MEKTVSRARKALPAVTALLFVLFAAPSPAAADGGRSALYNLLDNQRRVTLDCSGQAYPAASSLTVSQNLCGAAEELAKGKYFPTFMTEQGYSPGQAFSATVAGATPQQAFAQLKSQYCGSIMGQGYKYVGAYNDGQRWVVLLTSRDVRGGAPGISSGADTPAGPAGPAASSAGGTRSAPVQTPSGGPGGQAVAPATGQAAPEAGKSAATVSNPVSEVMKKTPQSDPVKQATPAPVPARTVTSQTAPVKPGDAGAVEAQPQGGREATPKRPAPYDTDYVASGARPIEMVRNTGQEPLADPARSMNRRAPGDLPSYLEDDAPGKTAASPARTETAGALSNSVPTGSSALTPVPAGASPSPAFSTGSSGATPPPYESETGRTRSEALSRLGPGYASSELDPAPPREVYNYQLSAADISLMESLYVQLNEIRSSGYMCGKEKKQKAPALRKNSALSVASASQASDMASSSSTSTVGIGPRARGEGFGGSSVAGHATRNTRNASVAMGQFLKDGGACADIMNPRYTDIGVGFSPDGGGVFVITLGVDDQVRSSPLSY